MIKRKMFNDSITAENGSDYVFMDGFNGGVTMMIAGNRFVIHTGAGDTPIASLRRLAPLISELLLEVAEKGVRS